jgi:hypothetical protein
MGEYAVGRIHQIPLPAWRGLFVGLGWLILLLAMSLSVDQSKCGWARPGSCAYVSIHTLYYVA